MKCEFIQADATRLPFADDTFAMVFGSPPYMDARTYGIGAQRSCEAWVEWMLTVVTELTRVCNGLVLINCAGVTRDRTYWPGCEGLMWEWWKRGLGSMWRPAYWHRVGIPGSGGKQWLRADIEYVIPFKRNTDWLEWADNTANGHVPKWAPGGEMSYRQSDGSRRNAWGQSPGQDLGNRKSDGERDKRRRKGRTESLPMATAKRIEHAADGTVKGDHDRLLGLKLANPGNIVKVIVGGGLMGHQLAHVNEAPFPQKLAEWFIRGWCPPAGRVLDPFSGSGTTCAAAIKLGRVGVGCDLRFSQCELGAKRCRDVQPEMF